MSGNSCQFSLLLHRHSPCCCRPQALEQHVHREQHTTRRPREFAMQTLGAAQPGPSSGELSKKARMGAKLNAQPKSLLDAGRGSREVVNGRDQRGHSSVPAALQVQYVSIPTSHRPSATCRAVSGISAPARDAGEDRDSFVFSSSFVPPSVYAHPVPSLSQGF